MISANLKVIWEMSDVSPLQYQSFNCKQIGLEIGRLSRRVHEVSGQQEDTAEVSIGSELDENL